jgi:hypothetical protein
LATPSSANLATAVTDETGSGALVFGTSPTIATPTITTNMTGPLYIGGTGTTSTLTLRSTSGAGTTGADIVFQTGNNGATEAMRILNNGKVGFGTNNPTSPVEIYSATSSGILVRGDAAVTPTFQRSSTDVNEAALALYKTRGTNAVPTAIASSDALGSLYFQGYGGTNVRNLAFIRSLVSTYTSDSNISSYLSFGTSPSGAAAATEVMRIDPAGQVGIGVAPTANLDVYNASATQVQFRSDGTAAMYIQRSSTDATEPTMFLKKTRGNNGTPTAVTSADGLGTIHFRGYGGTTDRNLAFVKGVVDTFTSDSNISSYLSFGVSPSGSAAGAEKVRINQYGLGAGLTPTNRNNTSLHTVDGLGFPATQVSSSDANTLDDYEEGSWTPSVGGSATYTAQNGRYTKIGNKVTIECLLTINVIGTGSQSVISGLPFSPAGSEPSGGITMHYWGSTAVSLVYLNAFVSGTTLLLYGATAAAATLSATNAMTSATVLRFTGQYTTA